jgi:hypothetical protein
MQRVSLVLAVAIATAALVPAATAAATAPAGAIADENGRATADRPIEKVMVCYGIGWRGPGYYPSILGLRPACWDTLPSGGAIYPAPPLVYAVPGAPVYPSPQPGTSYYCDDPRGYYPSVMACNGGWRAVPAVP